MIDLHCHILPRLDDGAGSLEESLEMAAAALEDGTRAIAGTPHVRDDWPNEVVTIEGRAAEVRSALAEAGLPLELLPGAEIAFDRVGCLDAVGLARLGLGGNPRCLLVEPPYVEWPIELDRIVHDLAARGFVPVIAHPERNPQIQAEPERLRPLVLGGALVQITAASVDGRLGRRSRTAAFDLLDRGLAHIVASDAHSAGGRGVGLAAAAAAVGDEELARWLTEGVPGAIVSGEPIPSRPGRTAPPGRRRRRLWPPGTRA
ncbi:MAG: tyrosine protein phosphatase [Thermoleophilia bacterium]|nr:tyrosine protein phosphatase [Thermoleophilia bacterium]